MGGRGSAGGVVGSGGAAANINLDMPKMSDKQINSLSRGQLEAAATVVFVKTNVARGLCHC